MSSTILRALSATALLGAAAFSAVVALREVLPSDGRAAHGVTLDGEPVDGAIDAFVAARAAEALGKSVKLGFGGETLFEGTLADLGATADTVRAIADATAVGRERDPFARLADALAARRGDVDVHLAIHVPVDVLAEKLDRAKEERDLPAVPARYSIATKTATDDTPGRFLDLYAAAALLEKAVGSRAAMVADVPVFAITPKASRDAVAKIDVDQIVSSFTTRFGFTGGQANRGKNVIRAASQMDGVVLMPGDVVSFNANVGPRSVENGFFTAPEIFKGELREGIGGGTCQVAGTLHAAAYLGGVTIAERANHSRPSGYIGIGLDATVVYPTTDLKLENPYDFPIVIHAIIDNGALTFELRGRERAATVAYATELLGSKDFERKLEDAPFLHEGQFKLKQKGIVGRSIKKTRVITYRDGQTKTEVTHDTYPPTLEIWQVGPNTDPSALPPFNGEHTEIPVTMGGPRPPQTPPDKNVG